jgi:hypothetical protein
MIDEIGHTVGFPITFTILIKIKALPIPAIVPTQEIPQNMTTGNESWL